MEVMSSLTSMCLRHTLVSFPTFTLCLQKALEADSAVTTIVMMERMTNLIVWKWIGLKLMVAVAGQQLCTQFLEQVQVLATTGAADQPTALEAQSFT